MQHDRVRCHGGVGFSRFDVLAGVPKNGGQDHAPGGGDVRGVEDRFVVRRFVGFHLLFEHVLDVVHDGVHVSFWFVVVLLFGVVDDLAVAVGDDPLDLVQGHQALDQVAVVVERVEFVSVGIEQVYGTRHLRSCLRLRYRFAGSVRKVGLRAVSRV